VTDYAAVLVANYPDVEWTVRGNDYATLEWHDDTPKPTQGELDAAWPAVQQQQADAVAAKVAARQSGLDKLAALGLTVDEVSAVFGV
jgi:hypothetical protein